MGPGMKKAGGQNRTDDLRFTKPLLYRLSYASVMCGIILPDTVCERKRKARLGDLRLPLADGQGDGNGRALAFLAGDIHRAVVQAHDLVADRKTEAGTPHLGGEERL